MRALTVELVHQKAKTDKIHMLTKLNMWGIDLTDVSLVREMPALQVLSLSVNNISNLEPFACLRNLQELYLRRNNISDMGQLSYLTGLKNLKVLWLSENPIANEPFYREIVIKCLPNLEKLDDRNITEQERENVDNIDLDSLLVSTVSRQESREPAEQTRVTRAKTTNDLSSDNMYGNTRMQEEFAPVGRSRQQTEAQFAKKPSFGYEQQESIVYQEQDSRHNGRRQVNAQMPVEDYNRVDFNYNSNPHSYNAEPRRRNDSGDRRARYNAEYEESLRKQAIEDQIRKQVQLDEEQKQEELRREEARRRQEKKRAQLLENRNQNYSNNSYSPSPERRNEPKGIKNDNVMSAILILLGDLSEIELEIIRSECVKKLDDIRG